MTRTIYGFDDLGRKIPIGSYEAKPLVGGIIFYIDSTADGTYTFYNAQGTQVSAPTVGTDCTNWTYEVNGATKDKFYVYNPTAMLKANSREGTQASPWLSWTYFDENNQSYIDETEYAPDSSLPSGKQPYEYYGIRGRVYEATNTGTSIGTGKSNTLSVMALRNGVYKQSAEPNLRYDENYAETIWYACDQFNNGVYTLCNNITNCSDWYIPSKDELETLKDNVGSQPYDLFTLLYNNVDDTPISNIYVSAWSSSERSTLTGEPDGEANLAGPAEAWTWIWDGEWASSYEGAKICGSDGYLMGLALIRSF